MPSRYNGSASTCKPQLVKADFEQNGGLLRTSTSRSEGRKWHGLVEEAIGSQQAYYIILRSIRIRYQAKEKRRVVLWIGVAVFAVRPVGHELQRNKLAEAPCHLGASKWKKFARSAHK